MGTCCSAKSAHIQKPKEPETTMQSQHMQGKRISLSSVNNRNTQLSFTQSNNDYSSEKYQKIYNKFVSLTGNLGDYKRLEQTIQQDLNQLIHISRQIQNFLLDQN